MEEPTVTKIIIEGKVAFQNNIVSYDYSRAVCMCIVATVMYNQKEEAKVGIGVIERLQVQCLVGAVVVYLSKKVYSHYSVYSAMQWYLVLRSQMEKVYAGTT